MPKIINTQYGIAYVVARINEEGVPEGGPDLYDEVTQHPDTPGNYTLLKGKNAQLPVGFFVGAAIAGNPPDQVLYRHLVGEEDIEL